MTINREPLSDEEVKAQTLAPKYAVDEFIRQIQRNPTRTELQYVGRWPPPAAIRQAELNPDGEPDTLVPIKIPNAWNEVSVYAELTVCNIHGPNIGMVVGFKSLRYHDGDDALWPMRTHTGELIRSDGGHLIVSPTFRAPHMSVEPCSACTWPSDVQDKGMWHLEQFIRPMWNYQHKRPPEHLRVAGPAMKIAPPVSRESELERRIAELENERRKK